MNALLAMEQPNAAGLITRQLYSRPGKGFCADGKNVAGAHRCLPLIFNQAAVPVMLFSLFFWNFERCSQFIVIGRHTTCLMPPCRFVGESARRFAQAWGKL